MSHYSRSSSGGAVLVKNFSQEIYFKIRFDEKLGYQYHLISNSEPVLYYSGFATMCAVQDAVSNVRSIASDGRNYSVRRDSTGTMYVMSLFYNSVKIGICAPFATAQKAREHMRDVISAIRNVAGDVRF